MRHLVQIKVLEMATEIIKVSLVVMMMTKDANMKVAKAVITNVANTKVVDLLQKFLNQELQQVKIN